MAWAVVVNAQQVLQVVKAGQGKEGSIRCTFEDKILMSDIVFLRAWVNVDIPRFFNPVTTLLQLHGSVWRGMKTVAELRKEKGLSIPANKNSIYKVGFLVFIFASSVKFWRNINI